MAIKKEAPYKWNFAIGTTSRVPNSKQGLHYFIADFDGIDFVPLTATALLSDNEIIIQKTPNGIHLYSNLKLTFKQLIRLLKICGADPGWIRIGKKRGYFFLADKNEVEMNWPVERMFLRWNGAEYVKKEG